LAVSDHAPRIEFTNWMKNSARSRVGRAFVRRHRRTLAVFLLLRSSAAAFLEIV